MHRLLSFAVAFGAAGLLLVPAAAPAQTTTTGPMAAPSTSPNATAPFRRRRGSPYMRALRTLNLTDAQKTQIRTIMQNQEQALRTQIDGVLTPDQRAQLRASLQQQPQPGSVRPATSPRPAGM
jgi:Spy/CpxP family protein refolding chaperone